MYIIMENNSIPNPHKFIPKNHPTSNREWSNSIYTYNNNIVNTSHNYNILNLLLKMYFRLRPKRSINTKSKRMRNLLRKGTTKRMFVSDAEVKQTNDKVTVTVYTYNRANVNNNRRLFYLKNRLHSLCKFDKHIVNLKKFLVRKKRRISRRKTKKLPLGYRINFYKYSNLILRSMLRKHNDLKAIYTYRFLKWSFTMLGMKVLLFRKGTCINAYTSRKFKHTKLLFYSDTILIVEGKVYSTKYYGKKVTVKCLNKDNVIGSFNINSSDSTVKLRNINLLLTVYLKKVTNDKNNEVINFLIKNFRFKFNMFKTRWFYRKQKWVLMHLKKIYSNKYKYNKLISGLKVLVSYIYKKKVEFNMVNLRYLHLNSNIFSEAIAVKLRKKTSKLLRVLRRVLKIVKLPRELHRVKENPLSRMRYIINENQLNSNINIKSTSKVKDRVQNILNKLFPKKKYNLISYKKSSSSVNNILRDIKYKWVTGVKIEAKGRLTRRFTASRALYKFKQKGNLRNLEYMYRPGSGDDKIGVYNMRNQIKPNLQYTLATSKRRVGTYGIKGWINSI